MAGTSYVEIYDLFLSRIQDWHLDSLYDRSEEDFNTYLQAFLILAIPDFEDICTQDLEDRDDSDAEFNITLTTANQVILSLIMVKKWLDKEIRNVNQMSLHLQDREFHSFAEANNLKAKQDYAIVLAEEISQKLVEYGYKNNDWDSWLEGTFYVSS